MPDTLRLPADFDRIIGQGDTTPPDNLTVACYTFPHFHRSALNDQIYAPGWTEYTITRGGRPWFPGHHQPRTPLLGELDERDPATWVTYVDLAVDMGVDAFIFDWYWFGSAPAFHEALEEGFLLARGRERVKFAVLWTNHPWARWFPTAGLKPADEWLAVWADEHGSWEPTHPAPETPEDVWRSLTYIIARYFHDPGYLTVADLPFLPIWDVSLLLRVFGTDGTRQLFDELRAFARKLGHPGIHLHGVCQEVGMAKAKHELMKIGMDSYGIYQAIAAAVGGRPPEEDILDYEILAADAVTKVWPEYDALLDMPFFPSISPGCDDSPRHIVPTRPEQPNRKQWPGTVIATNESPAAFEALAKAAIAFLNDRPNLTPILTIGCWNEWTEGHYLLPDTKHGYGMARALARALQRGTAKIEPQQRPSGTS